MYIPFWIIIFIITGLLLGFRNIAIISLILAVIGLLTGGIFLLFSALATYSSQNGGDPWTLPIVFISLIGFYYLFKKSNPK